MADENGNGSSSPAPEAASRKRSKPKAGVSSKMNARHKARPTAKKVNAPAPLWNFPKNTLEESIRVAQAIEEKFAGNPVKADQIVKAVGFHKVEDWRFKSLIRSANLYGLISGSGTGTPLKLEQIGSDIVAPQGPEQRRMALMRAFENVELFKRVLDYYRGKKLPEDEYFSNTLVREFGVERDRVETFIRVFVGNAQFLDAFKIDGDGRPVIEQIALDHQPAPRPAVRPGGTGEDASKTPAREFLDTCFILMPFGEWYDRYYREVYVAATKEANFEPIRADGLFSTGTVIEQIWEQITKSKVLLAELTGKNANVFYELGLAHAICKPVVLITGNLDDVPFDLRHLRVIVYDVRDPLWGEKLRKSITAYLRSAKSDPDKSIPQPFRAMRQEEESSQ